MTDVLARIVERKRLDLENAKRAVPPGVLESRARRAPPPVDFAAALRRPGAVSLIAEMKRASPSAGLLRDPYDPAGLARAYARAGARALSVLTEEPHFGGRLEHLGAARAAGLPLLRKDFLVDAYQLFEARAAGADAALLIVRVLDDGLLTDLVAAAEALGLAALVEVHDEAELDRALAAGARLIGLNSRDLASLTVDLGLFDRLVPRVPADRLVVAESGIKTPADVARLEALGVHAMLVGESLLRQTDVEQAARALTGFRGA